MSSFLWSAVLFCPLALGQLASETSVKPLDVPKAIEQLGDADFATREAATKALWAEGKTAEEQLVGALKHADPEVRFRAAMIIDRFKRGLYPDTPPESAAAIEMFNRDPRLRTEALRQLKTSGDWKTMVRLIKAPRSEAERAELSQSVRHELGPMINERVRQGDLATAKELLALLAFSDAEGARRRLAFFQLQAGELPARVATLEKETILTDAQRAELVTLYELQGEFGRARRAATKDVASHAWRLRLAERAGEWSAAADLVETGDPTIAMEEAGVSAAFYRQAHEEAPYRERVEKLRKFAADPKLAYRAGHALLILGETDAGLEIMKTVQPPLAFDLNVTRHDYAAALALAKTAKDSAFDRNWFDQLPGNPQSTYPPPLQRCYTASAVAVTLHKLGERDEANKIGDVLVAVLDEVLALPPKAKPGVRPAPAVDPFGPAPKPRPVPAPVPRRRPPVPDEDPFGDRPAPRPRAVPPDDDPFGYRPPRGVDPFVDEDPFGEPPVPRAPMGRAAPAPAPAVDLRDFLPAFARITLETLRKIERTDDAFAIAARLLDQKVDRYAVISPLFGSGDHDANGWFEMVSLRYPDDTSAQKLAKTRRVITPDDADDFWREMITEAQKRGPAPADADPFGGPVVPVTQVMCIQLCKRHGRADLALEIADKSESPTIKVLAGDLHFAAGRFGEAEKKYRAVAGDEHVGALACYLTGLALENQGAAKEAAPFKAKSLLISSGRDDRGELFKKLTDLGYRTESTEVARQLYRLSYRFELHYDQTLGNLQVASDPLAAANHFEAIRRALLGRSNIMFTETGEQLTFPHTVARVRARGYLNKGQVDEALRELTDCRRILPRDPGLVERFVPRLTSAGKKAEADALFDEVFAAQEKICAEWPRAAWHHNAVAWMSARCERKLDDALQHALEATKLRPQDAAFADTLAEVYFVRGDVGKAIETQRRAVELAPAAALFKARLAQFEAAQRGEKPQRTFSEAKDDV